MFRVLRSETTLAVANAPMTSANPSTSHMAIGRPMRRTGAAGGFGVVVRGTVACRSKRAGRGCADTARLRVIRVTGSPGICASSQNCDGGSRGTMPTAPGGRGDDADEFRAATERASSPGPAGNPAEKKSPSSRSRTGIVLSEGRRSEVAAAQDRHWRAVRVGVETPPVMLDIQVQLRAFLEVLVVRSPCRRP